MDRTVKGRIYPALAQHQARPFTPGWREFGKHWPFTTPLRLQEYCQQHGVKLDLFEVGSELPNNTYYPICLGFFDFSIDYLELVPPAVKDLVRNKQVQVLFMYHEGDNPLRIKNRLNSLCQQHDLDSRCYVFVSSNTQADRLPGFVCFQDFELWYYQRNLATPALEAHNCKRDHSFTVLNRIHKSWRLAAMSDLYQLGVLDRSVWSYCQEPGQNNHDQDCPIEVDAIPQLRWAREKFINQLPHYCDQLDHETRNDHSVMVSDHYHNSYCNIVIESQFDVDQSGGTFLTEKTFKPIKHAQLFVIAGGAGSIQCLRELGYDVFDDVIDHSYDNETDHTQRWLLLRNSILDLCKQDLHTLYISCLDRLIKNQEIFMSSKQHRLNRLLEKINDCY